MLKVISEYQSYIIGFFATIISGWILWRAQKDRYGLLYYIASSDDFPTSAEEIGKYFIIILENTGNKAITDCSLDVSFKKGKIHSYKFSNEKRVDVRKHTEKSIEAVLPLLNPKERIQLTITATKSEEIDFPLVDARAHGVNGKNKKDTFWKKNGVAIVLLGIVALIVIVGPILDKGPTREDQIFVAMNKAGLSQTFAQLHVSSENFAYKDAGFQLFYLSLLDEENNDKYVKCMEYIAALDVKMTGNSRSTIYYLLGKNAQFRKDEGVAKSYFEKSKECDSQAYDFFMQNDDSFDIPALQKWLKENWDKDANRQPYQLPGTMGLPIDTTNHK